MASKKNEHVHLYTCLGEVISERRKRLNITQEELAEDSGINRTFIGNVEHGKRNPSIGAVASIARGLRTRPSKLLASCEFCVKEREAKE